MKHEPIKCAIGDDIRVMGAVYDTQNPLVACAEVDVSRWLPGCKTVPVFTRIEISWAAIEYSRRENAPVIW